MRRFALVCGAALALAGCEKVKDLVSGPKTAFNGNAALGYVKVSDEPSDSSHMQRGYLQTDLEGDPMEGP